MLVLSSIGRPSIGEARCVFPLGAFLAGPVEMRAAKAFNAVELTWFSAYTELQQVMDSVVEIPKRQIRPESLPTTITTIPLKRYSKRRSTVCFLNHYHEYH